MPSYTYKMPAAYGTTLQPFARTTNRWILSRSNLNYLMTDLANHVNSLPALFTNPIENVVSVKWFPFPIDSICSHVDPESYLSIGTWTSVITKGRLISGDINIVNLVTLASNVKVTPKWGGCFLDKAPYTEIKLFLPYVGLVDVEPVWMYEGVDIVYSFDIITGGCRAYICDHGNQFILSSYDGKCSIDYMVGGGQGFEIANNILGLTSGMFGAGTSAILGGAIAGAPGTAVGLAVGLLSSLPATALNAINALKINVSRSGSMSGGLGVYDPPNPFILIKRPITPEATLYPEGFAHHFGRPMLKRASILSLDGFTKASDVQWDAPLMTEAERNELEYILESGVYSEAESS